MAMMVFFTSPSSLVGGFIADRVPKGRLKFLLAGALLCQAMGIGAFLLNQSMGAVYVLLVFFGFGSGPIRPLLVIIRGRYFGRKAYGSIEGTSLLFETPSGMLAPVYAGWVYDTTGNYMTAFMLFAASAAFAALLTSIWVRGSCSLYSRPMRVAGSNSASWRTASVSSSHNRR